MPLLTLAIELVDSSSKSYHQITELDNTLQQLISNISTFHPWFHGLAPNAHTASKISYVPQSTYCTVVPRTPSHYIYCMQWNYHLHLSCLLHIIKHHSLIGTLFILIIMTFVGYKTNTYIFMTIYHLTLRCYPGHSDILTFFKREMNAI